jgi:hypothetical protein
MGPEKLPPPKTSLSQLSQALLLFGIFMIVVLGIFPQLVYFMVVSIIGMN